MKFTVTNDQLDNFNLCCDYKRFIILMRIRRVIGIKLTCDFWFLKLNCDHRVHGVFRSYES